MSDRAPRKISSRAKLYLRCCTDWKADYEVADALGDTPPMKPTLARIFLGRLIGWGLVEWHRGNNTYRCTEAGLARLR